MQLTTKQLRNTRVSRGEFPTLPKMPIQFVLDGVNSGYNIGAILRTADALRAECVTIVLSRTPEDSPRLMKTSRGVVKWIKHQWVEKPAETVRRLKSEGYRVVGVELTDRSVELSALRPAPKFALVLGGETTGVSAEVLALCDEHAHLPMLGMGNSLNVSVVAGVVGYHCLGLLSR